MNNAISLNNEAISLLQSSLGDKSIENDALSLFTRSLTALKKIVLDQEEDTTSTSPARAVANRRVLTTTHFKETAEESGKDLFVYDRMFHLFPSTTKKTPNAILQLCIAAVVFNIALLYQYQASTMIPSKSQNLCLEKASKLYLTCSLLLRQLPPQYATIKDDTSFLLEVASLNNAAQISYEFQHYESATQQLNIAATLLCSRAPHLNGHQEDLTDQDYEGILANVYLLKAPTVAGAA